MTADSTDDFESDDEEVDEAPTVSKAPQPEEPPPPGKMLPKEQQTGYLVAAAVAVLVAVIGGSRLVAGKSGYGWATPLGLAGAAAIAFGAYRGRRTIAAFASVLAGLALSAFLPLNFVCLIYGGFLMFRQNQAQKKLNLTRPRGARPARSRPERVAGRRGGGRNPPPTNRPKPNRRYTPPKAKTTRRSR